MRIFLIGVSIPNINRNDITSQDALRATYFLGEDLTLKINDFCKANNLSTYSFFMAVFSLYLANAANYNDVVIGSPILNRTNFKDKNCTGMFISTIPFRNKIDGDISLLYHSQL